MIFSINEIDLLGKALLTHLQPGKPMFLQGPLGVGKTTIARGIIRQFFKEDYIPSPSFPIMLSYPFKTQTLWHMDLYRLNTEEECAALDIPELFQGYAIVEWPERLGKLKPEVYLGAVLSFSKTSVPEEEQETRHFSLYQHASHETTPIHLDLKDY